MPHGDIVNDIACPRTATARRHERANVPVHHAASCCRRWSPFTGSRIISPPNRSASSSRRNIRHELPQTEAVPVSQMPAEAATMRAQAEGRNRGERPRTSCSFAMVFSAKRTCARQRMRRCEGAARQASLPKHPRRSADVDAAPMLPLRRCRWFLLVTDFSSRRRRDRYSR